MIAILAAAIVLGPQVWVSSDRPRDPDVETFLAINPRNAKQMVATSTSFHNGQTETVVYFSGDAGKHWKLTGVQADGGDPIVYYDNYGAALFGSIGTSEGSDFFSVWRSSNGGATWDSKAHVPGLTYDRQYLAVDGTTGPYAGRIYADGTVTVKERVSFSKAVLGISHSDDGGRTFSPATAYDSTSANGIADGFGGSGDMLVTSDGTLVIPMLSALGTKAHFSRAFSLLASDDGGRTFVEHDGLPFTWATRHTMRSLVTSTNVRAAIDPSSGPYGDRIYVTYMNYKNGRFEVDVTYSDNLGITWSRPVVVNNNRGPNDISNIAIAVNRRGVVAVTWNDRRDDPSDMCFRLYGSASLDGGRSFLPNVKIASRPSCPGTAANWTGSVYSYANDGNLTLSSVSDRFMNGGETQGLVASPDGGFHATWSSDVNHLMQLWYGSFVVKGAINGSYSTHGPVTMPAPVGPDLTSVVSIDATKPEIDFRAKAIQCTIRVKNLSRQTFHAPLTLQLSDIQTDFEDLALTNAQNGKPGAGATWAIPIGSTGLAPGRTSGPVTVRWRFNGVVPPPKHLLYQFGAQFKVIEGQ